MVIEQTFSPDEIFEILDWFLGSQASNITTRLRDNNLSAEEITNLLVSDWTNEYGLDRSKAVRLRKKLHQSEENPYRGSEPDLVFKSFCASPTRLKAEFLVQYLGTEKFAVADLTNPFRLDIKATACFMNQIIPASKKGAKKSGSENSLLNEIFVYQSDFYLVESVYKFIQSAEEMVPCDFDNNPLNPQGYSTTTNIDWGVIDPDLRTLIFQVVVLAKQTAELSWLSTRSAYDPNTQTLSEAAHREIFEIAKRPSALGDILKLMPVACRQYVEARRNGRLPILLVSVEEEACIFTVE